MKKLKYVVMLFIILLSVGCGSKDGSKILEEALDNMKNVDSGTIEVEMNVAMDGQAINMDMTTDFTADGNSYTKSTSTMLGMSFTTESYTIKDGDNVYIYNTEDGENWTYRIVSANEYVSEDISVDSVGGFAENYKSVTEVKSDKEGHTKLEVVVDKEEVMNSLALSQENGSEAAFELDEDLKMYVYVKDGYITGLSLDFKDILQMSEDDSITNYSMDFTISHHNSLDEIVVSEDIINNAVLEEE